ncbi:MAG: acetyl-CoA carboxylase biotin carboxyl carrier protein subunit [FCB group bacterium]|jgi:biotin carboxyl carrier protein
MELTYKNNLYNLDVEVQGENCILNINNEKITIPVRQFNENIFSVFLNNKYTNAYSAEDDNHFYINIEGENFVFDKVKESENKFFDDCVSADKDIIKPPMPGSIVKILVEKGQKVKENDSLIIVEAMKMETTLYSSIDGVITEINVSAGQQVDSDVVLIVVEKE